MNNFFNYTRFSLLIKRQWIENRKLFLMASFAILGLQVIAYVISTNWNFGHISVGIQPVFFLGMALVVGTYFTNYIFKDFADKNSSTSFLLIPASHFEKLLSNSFYCLILFPIVFIAIFSLIDYAFVSYANNIMHEKKLFDPIVYPPNVMLFQKPNLFVKPLIGGWLISQVAMTIGSLTFVRWSFMKTVFSVFAFMLVLALLSNFVFRAFLNEFDVYSSKHNYSIYEQIKPTKDTLELLTKIAIQYIIAPILLLITYLKLKEKQV